MWSNITKGFLGQEDQNVIIKVDPSWGFAEFPPPGDVKKHLLPVLIDPEETATAEKTTAVTEGKNSKASKEFWMPDRFCKVCYGCEEPFTMYRRRHHCRMCGQIFCNNCSSYSIDGALFNALGLVRACKDCFEQTSSNDTKSTKKKTLVVDKGFSEPMLAQQRIRDEYRMHNERLQDLASTHLSEIVDNLVRDSPVLNLPLAWKDIVLNLVKSVVSTVDPDVRNGDSLDIRPYIKIKVIPGGSREECTYIDGVVFRKNVSHKKMSTVDVITSPKILLLAGGIEFQRTEIKLSSMDTLIEQEDKYMELLVEKIMSLKPDIILVGKAVARRAQELLCEHNAIVMQNVKLSVLERVARMTGAMLLPSTDNMIQQFGDDCLGSCGSFFMKLVQDDPERCSQTQPQRVLRTRISRASTYTYFQGCPSERGCSLILRGGQRSELAEVKRIVRLSILIAYHLRLEVAYYNDRFADIVPLDTESCGDDGSDVDDEIVDESKTLGDDDGDANPVVLQMVDQNPKMKSPRARKLLSTSLDIDFNIPYRRELIGTSLFRSKNLSKFHIEGHQTLLITSVMMGEGSQQKSSADVKGIKYYTKHDIALGHFILENCFHFGRNSAKDSKMCDQTLSFVHRPGRIDISVRRVERLIEDSINNTLGVNRDRDLSKLSLSISSYCKECGRVVAPPHVMSEEVYKMSLGKFLEILFYNRSAVCSVGECNHSLRDDHILSFTCENYMASFEFIPIHAYALHVRNYMTFPEEFYWQQTLSILSKLPESHAIMMEDFKLSMVVLEREVRDLLQYRQEDMTLALADVQLMECELQSCSISFLEELLKTYRSFPKVFQDPQMEGLIEQLLERYSKSNFFKQEKVALLPAIAESDERGSESESFSESTSISEVGFSPMLLQEFPRAEINPSLASQFPMMHFRDTYLRAVRWNTRIDNIYKFLESVRSLLWQQVPGSGGTALAGNPAIGAGNVNVVGGGQVPVPNAVSDELEAQYLFYKRHMAEGLISDLKRIGNSDTLQQALSIHLSALSSTTSEKQNIANSSQRDDDRSLSATPLPQNSVDVNGSSIVSDPSIVPTLNVLYKSTLEQPSNKRMSDRPNDKMSRITKALSRFLVLGNKDANADDDHNISVPLGDFGSGRFGLKPGRNGVVIPVHEDILASIIAYALASNEYQYHLNNSIRQVARDDQDATVGRDDLDVACATRPEDLQQDREKEHGSTRGGNKQNQFDDDDEDREEENEGVTGADVKSTNYGLTKLMGNFNNNDDSSGQNMESGMFGTVAAPNAANGPNTAPTGGNSTAMFNRSNKSVVANTTSEGEQMPHTDGSNRSKTTATDDNSANSSAPQQGTAASNASEPLLMRSSTLEDAASAALEGDGMSANEKQMTSQDKSNIRIRFHDYNDRGQLVCKFQCQVYYAKQFEALRTCYFNEESSIDNFVRALAMTARWNTQGGKSGASFSKTMDERFVIKAISKVELQMYLDFAPAYFEYMAKAYYHNLPSVLCKILGVFTVRYDNKETGKKSSENVVVMENIFYQRNITKTFDLKGSSRARYTELQNGEKLEPFDNSTCRRRGARRKLRQTLKKTKASETDPQENHQTGTVSTDPIDPIDADVDEEVRPGRPLAKGDTIVEGEDDEVEANLIAALGPAAHISQVLLDDNLMEFTKGRPFPLKHRAKLFFHKAVQNDTLFLSIVNVVDYSILVGVDEDSHELVVGIIDYLRQYDFIKRMERLGKGSVGILTGQADPTIIQPNQYRKRFSLAMDRYFMTVPDKWIHYDA